MVLNTTRKETTKMDDNYANTDLLQTWTYCKHGPTEYADMDETKGQCNLAKQNKGRWIDCLITKK